MKKKRRTIKKYKNKNPKNVRIKKIRFTGKNNSFKELRKKVKRKVTNMLDTINKRVKEFRKTGNGNRHDFLEESITKENMDMVDFIVDSTKRKKKEHQYFITLYANLNSRSNPLKKYDIRNVDIRSMSHYYKVIRKNREYMYSIIVMMNGDVYYTVDFYVNEIKSRFYSLKLKKMPKFYYEDENEGFVVMVKTIKVRLRNFNICLSKAKKELRNFAKSDHYRLILRARRFRKYYVTKLSKRIAKVRSKKEKMFTKLNKEKKIGYNERLFNDEMYMELFKRGFLDTLI